VEAIAERRALLFSRLFSLVREAQRRTDEFDQAVADYLDVSRTEARCMDVLHQAGPMTAGQLAQHTRLTTGAITKVVDRLAGAGYVRRASDPRDRRRVIIELTTRARRLANDLYAIPEAAMTDFQHQFSDNDIEVLIRYFELGQAATDLRMTRLKAKRRRRPTAHP
jgi:DNA-binding MarR family transcriptional regulator